MAPPALLVVFYKEIDMYYQKKKPVDWAKHVGHAIQIVAGIAMLSYIVLKVLQEMGVA